MTITVHERPGGRRQGVGKTSKSEREYLIVGATTEAQARTALLAEIPGTLDSLPLDDVNVEDVPGVAIYIGKAAWVDPATAGQNEKREVGDSTFAFEIATQTQNVKQSLGTRRYGVRAAPDFKGAIGVTKDSVEGVDVMFPTYAFSEEHILPASLITAGYKAILFALCAKTNNATFRGFEAGEVLFLGAAGSKRGTDDWAVSFKFIASKNLTGLEIGSITGIVKYGWEYLWTRYIDEIDTTNNFVVKVPLAVYVEQVYRSGDFSLIGI